MSTWGVRHGLPGYDAFRTGITFREARRMLWVHDDDRTRWRHKRRHTVLGFMHELKLMLWYSTQDGQR